MLKLLLRTISKTFSFARSIEFVILEFLSRTVYHYWKMKIVQENISILSAIGRLPPIYIGTKFRMRNANRRMLSKSCWHFVLQASFWIFGVADFFSNSWENETVLWYTYKYLQLDWYSKSLESINVMYW